MNIKRPIPLFAVAVALPSAFSYGCNDDRQGLDQGSDVEDDEYVCCTNEGWYPLGYYDDADVASDTDAGDVYDEPYYSTNEGWYPLDGGDDGDVGVDAADTDALDTDADDVEDEPYYSTNEGWYPLDGGYGYDAGSYDAGEGSGADATDGDTEASLTPSGLDWVELAWCAPDPARPGLRAYRRIPSPFVVSDEEPA